ncbi:MAG: ATP-binding protein [Lachnospiraceae bacterium]|nr:ATP-binding protein [Lachnospiraceae bacterium]
MVRTVGIGIQEFGKIIENDCFYVDKTAFIKEWWENRDEVTLITRPRRFGKTLTMSMTEQFFSVKYADRGDLFEGLSIWQEEKYRALQGTYPVISLSFANIKETNYKDTRDKIVQLLASEYARCAFLLEGDCLNEQEKAIFRRKTVDMGDVDATLALNQLSEYLCRYYQKKVIILLDEYDTPMQEAYVHGYWEELVAFTRSMFNAAFKTNPWLERAIMTGITRVSKESIFSDLNNLKVVTTTSDEYGAAFGFTEEEVFAALDEYGMGDRKQNVKRWYDGFIFGMWKDIYNPWSILNFLDTGKITTYWANTSSNSLVGKLIREGSREVKESFERLIKGEYLRVPIDEQIVYNQLDDNEYAIWSLLVASGYLKILDYEKYEEDDIIGEPKYELALTNHEVKIMFQNMIRGWFAGGVSDYNAFIRALLADDLEAMNEYMNRIARETFSYFDTGKRASGKAEPERFYHGFVLGLMVQMEDQYTVTSNRESGFGRYDIMLEPKKEGLDAIVIEFKVFHPERDNSLEDTVNAALLQIEEKKYAQTLVAKGIKEDRIRKYGFAFEGKEVLIG